MSDREFRKAAETIEAMKARYGPALARGKIDVAGDDLDDFPKSEGIVVSKESASHAKLALSILEASLSANEISERRHAGEAIDITEHLPRRLRW